MTNSGKVKFFNESKGYGFIKDDSDGVDHFFHFTGVLDPVKKDDLVKFDLEKGSRGIKAVNVKKIE
jgi:CspA family cold shock protein